ncbi:MAG: DUF1501 domain-containing protein [Gemmataceae bacterium]
MLSIKGRARAACERPSRREILQAAGAGLLGLSLPRVLAAESQSAHSGRARSVIFLHLYGGPSQLETFDMKPDAPANIRGPFKPIAARTPGLLVCEHLPRLAARSHRFCVVRTMTHSYNDHSGAGHYIQTGHRWHVAIGAGFNATPRDWPSIGSVVEYLAQERGGKRQPLPSYAVVPNSLGRLQEFTVRLHRPGEYAGWLGQAYNPLTTAVNKKDAKDNPYWRPCSDDELNFQVEGLDLSADLRAGRLERRLSLLEQFEGQAHALEQHRRVRDFDRFQQRALALATSEKTRRALNIRTEPPRLRDRYGRHLFGQSTLMARRLVEAGVRFVTVHYDCVDGYSWDSHQNSQDVKSHLLPTFDQALAALLDDLEERGMLEDTLVVALGEMGRTPQANPQWGRNHWSTLFPAVLAGAGIQGGITHGKSDKDAAYPIEQPVTPEDLAATLYHALGIDPDLRVNDPQGRPVSLVEGGTPLLSLFA